MPLLKFWIDIHVFFFFIFFTYLNFTIIINSIGFLIVDIFSLSNVHYNVGEKECERILDECKEKEIKTFRNFKLSMASSVKRI